MPKKLIFVTFIAMFVLAFSCFVRAEPQPVQDAEAIALANQMSDAALRHDGAAADKLLDSDALFDRLSAGVSVSPEFLAGFKQGFRPQTHTMLNAIVNGDGTYHFLRVHQVNGETRILFRLLSKGGGLNYHDWIVARDQQGRLKLQDAYLATTGELLSQTMHGIYVQAALTANPGLMDRLTGKDKEHAANLTKFVQLGQESQKGQYQKVLDDYKTLPVSMQEDKTCLLFRFQAAEKLIKTSPQEYDAAMADYKRLFPGDASVDLICFDALLDGRQFDEARKALGRIAAFTGGDPYLYVMYATIDEREGGKDNLALAKQSLQKAIDEEPTLAKAYWALVTLSLETRNYDETAALLTEINEKLHIKLKDLTKVPAYAGFVKSDAYQKWLVTQPPDAPATPPH